MGKPKRTTKPKRKRVSHPVKKRSAESRALIAKVRKICLALPDATEKDAHGEPTWRVGGRVFAMFDDHHHGAAHISVWLPAPDGAQSALIEAEPDRIWRPPYVGHKGWIAVIIDDKPNWAMVEALTAQAHGLIATKRPRKK